MNKGERIALLERDLRQVERLIRDERRLLGAKAGESRFCRHLMGRRDVLRWELEKEMNDGEPMKAREQNE